MYLTLHKFLTLGTNAMHEFLTSYCNEKW